jgi:hypothetical protein
MPPGLSKIMSLFAGRFGYLCPRYWSTVPDSMRIVFFVIIGLVPAIQAQTLAGCRVFPANNIWNTRITYLPVDPNSDNYVSRIGATSPGHADFGSGLWDGGPIGIPYVAVPGTQPAVPVSFDYADESDPGPYPIPANAPIEGGSQSSGDRHVLVVDQGNCLLYEMFSSYPQTDGSWTAGSGAIFNLNSNALRTASWTSADAAGLPILPGLVKYDEVASGAILHAVRFTAPSTQMAYIWPARHYASSITDTTYPPMGARFRLKASFDISTFSPDTQVILTALKTYGMILADNGSAWFISGVPDSRWNNDDLHELSTLVGTDFEAVDESSLMLNANSGQAAVKSKPGILRSGFYWLLDADGNHAWDAPPDLAYAYGGIAGDVPITGDWNGTGHTCIGIYRPKHGLFLLDSNCNGIFDAGDAVYNFGVGAEPGDVPVVGDWNGSGTSKIGIFRQGFLWILDTDGDGVFEQGTDQTYAFGGVAGDVPVVGDWTGTGTSKIGVVRDGYFWILDANGNGTYDGTGPGEDLAFPFGGPGDVPVVGDWTGDGISKVGMFRDGFFWVLDANDPQLNGGGPAPLIAFAFGGVAGDKPVIGKW